MVHPVIRNVIQSKRFWIITTIIIVGIIGIFIMNQPSRGRVSPITTQTKSTRGEYPSSWENSRQKAIEQTKLASDQATGIVGSSTYAGKYFSLSYPNTLAIKNQSASESGILEKMILLDTGSTAQKVVATATRLPGIDSLDDVSAVQVRRLNPKRYSEQAASMSGTWGVRFDKKQNGYEAIVLVLKQQILYVLALTAPSLDPKLDGLFANLHSSVRIK
ncbi:hypothetical protein HY949_04840 [Candidatus Gottesmanbacteria bacterium]|nr:hypothetical protein [Candidatus Gottesmanbacteria bacterium]